MGSDSDDDRAVLVAVPGTLCAPLVFDALAGRLAGRVTVDPVAWMDGEGPWDLPSVADRLARHVEDVHGRPVLLAGHSTGGAIAVLLAARRPDLVDGLLLADTGAHMRGHGDVDAIITAVDEQWGPRLWATVLDRSFATPPEPAVRDALLAYAAAVPRQAALDALRSQRDLDLTPLLGSIAGPVAVLHGIEDRARSVDTARELAAGLPDATLRLLPCGHTPPHERPDDVAAAVEELLARRHGTVRGR